MTRTSLCHLLSLELVRPFFWRGVAEWVRFTMGKCPKLGSQSFQGQLGAKEY